MAAATTPIVGLESAGLIIIQRLHRLVRQGFRPWLGYDAASLLDGQIQLRRKKQIATLYADGKIVFIKPVALAFPRADVNARPIAQALDIAGDDQANFDALFPPNMPNKRSLTRRLYEIGL